MYVHLKKHNMENSLKDSQSKEFYRVPDKFIDCSNNIEQKLISKYKYLTVFNYKALKRKVNNLKYKLIEIISSTLRYIRLIICKN